MNPCRSGQAGSRGSVPPEPLVCFATVPSTHVSTAPSNEADRERARDLARAIIQQGNAAHDRQEV